MGKNVTRRYICSNYDIAVQRLLATLRLMRRSTKRLRCFYCAADVERGQRSK